MISNKYINAIIATLTTITILFTTIFYINTKNIDNINTNHSSNNFTYVNTVFNKDQITEVNIEVDENNWNYLLENAINEEYVNADITVNGNKYYNVGIRAKGNSSLSSVASDNTTDRYSFKVKFDEYVDGQTLDGLSKIALNNIMSDATYMKEYLSYDLLEKMSVPTPAFAFTNIKINGDEWGLYFAVEVIEEEFIARNYGSLSGNLYKPEGNEIGGKGNQNMKPNINNEDFAPLIIGNYENSEDVVPPNMNNGDNGVSFTPPDMNIDNNTRNTIPPTMNNGENPPPPNMDNQQNGENFTPPTGNEENIENINSNNKNNTTQGNDNFKDSGFRGGMMGGGMGSSNGGNLVYTNDNKDSYSDIFDNAIFKTTTSSDEDTVIEMLKNLNEGTNLE
ncbi:CotH kinase family protein [Clostridium tertium]